MKNTHPKRTKASKKKRKNAILYPIYKMFSWDLLSFYSIEFLFYTITKGATASQALIITAVYIISKMLFQIPSVITVDYLGKRKSMIFGNVLLVVYMSLLIWAPNFTWLAIATVFSGWGYDLKLLTEGNLLYDSVATKGGDGIYTKLESRGSSGYYILDTVLSIIAGYLFVINNYIPIYLSLFFLILSTVLSFSMKEIYHVEKKEKLSKFLKGYSTNIVDSFKFIKRSKRIRAYIIFATIFYGLIKLVGIYRSDLLVELSISAEQFSMIYAVLSLIAAISVNYTKRIQKYFRNKTLKVLSLSFILSMILCGVIAITLPVDYAIPLIIVFCTIMKIGDAQWYVTQYTYLKNFTSMRSRNKISFIYELITGCGASVLLLIGASVLDYVNIKYAMVWVGLLFLAVLIVILDYMRTRFGLRPSQYSNEDIHFYARKPKEKESVS